MKFTITSKREIQGLKSYFLKLRKYQVFGHILVHVSMFYCISFDPSITILIFGLLSLLLPLNFICTLIRPRRFMGVLLISLISVLLFFSIDYPSIAGSRFFKLNRFHFTQLINHHSFLKSVNNLIESDPILLPKEFIYLNPKGYDPNKVDVFVTESNREIIFHIIHIGIDNHTLLVYSMNGNEPSSYFYSLKVTFFEKLDNNWYLVKTT